MGPFRRRAIVRVDGFLSLLIFSMPSSLSLSHSHSLPIPSARPLSPKGVLRAGNGHSHTHTVLSILYLLAARQNKVWLEDKFPVARDHINILIPGLRPSALPRATNIPPRWGGRPGRWRTMGSFHSYFYSGPLHSHTHTHTPFHLLRAPLIP